MTVEHVDVLVVGAGISGIAAGYYLQKHCPHHRYAILEARDTLGGTWDLFRYPGIRSDSDMYTLGYSFRPWTDERAIADGATILNYLRGTATHFGIDQHIRLGHRVKHASWSSRDARWTLEVEHGAERTPVRLTCNFLFMCSGYYDYARGYLPAFRNSDRYRGRIIHPQHWPADFDPAGKRIAVIGSGATAVTLVPELAKRAAHVAMVQRSPSYVLSRPARDVIAATLRRWMPYRLAFRIARWKNILIATLFYRLTRQDPQRAARMLIGAVRKALGRDYDVRTHFTPSYNPWDQRLCLVPDGDLFEAIKSGQASVVTDNIESFTEDGIRFTTGCELSADIIITATGLNLQVFGGMSVSVDGKQMNFADSLIYKGAMFSDVPNFAASFGYANASWTLRAELTCRYVTRLLNHMQRTSMRQCTPRRPHDSAALPWLPLSSGYVTRALDRLPKQGERWRWRIHQNYVRDLLAFRLGSVTDAHLEFSNPGTRELHDAVATESSTNP